MKVLAKARVIIGLFSLIVTVCTAFYIDSVQAGAGLTDTRLDSGRTELKGHSGASQISSDGNGHVYVLWEDWRSGGIDIYFNYSEDDGRTWQASDIRLDTGGGWSNSPQLSSDGRGHVYAVWHSYQNGRGDIHFNYSADFGKTWQANEIRLDTGDTPGSNRSRNTQISSDSNGHVYVVWEDERNGESDIYFNFSDDYGETWQVNDTRLDTGDAAGADESKIPQLSSDSNGHVYVAWQDDRNGSDDIYFNYSEDYGETWQVSDIRLDTGDAPGEDSSYNPRISSDCNGHIYVVWEDGRSVRFGAYRPNIYLNYSDDYGETWQASDIRLDTSDEPSASSSRSPQISCDSKGHVYVVWQDNRNGSFDVYFNYSEDNGVTWQTSDRRLDTGDEPGADDSYFLQLLQISSDNNGHVYAVWHESREGEETDIYFNHSDDNGETWQTSDIRLDMGNALGSSNSVLPQISSDGHGHVYVVWEDEYVSRRYDGHIHFNYSDDYGITWQLSDKWLDTDTPVAGPGIGLSSKVQQSSDGNGHVYVVWEDRRNGLADIYFNYSEDNGVTWQTKDIRIDTGDVPGASDSLHPQICSDGNGYVYVVWEDDRNRHGKTQDIYLNYSADHGATWQKNDIRVDTGDELGPGYYDYVPQISCDGKGHVYVVWLDDRYSDFEIDGTDIYFNYSVDNGATWQASDTRLNTDHWPASSPSLAPQLSSDRDGHVFVVWFDTRGGRGDIYLNYSVDNGATWQANDIRLDTKLGRSASTHPQVNSDGNGHVYVAWHDFRNGSSDIYFNFSADHGITWLKSDVKLDTGDVPGASSSYATQISSDDKGHVYVVWQDKRNGEESDIYFNYSEDNGETWQISDIRLDTGDEPGISSSTNPQISSDDKGRVYVVWEDFRNGEAADIYLNFSEDNGKTWQKSDIRLDTGDTPGANNSDKPQLSSDGNGRVYVVWNDKRNTQNRTYFNYFFTNEIVNVNDFVTVNPIRSTYHWSSDTTDCPQGFVGTFSFDTEIKNRSDRPLSNLKIQVGELTRGNVIMVADGEAGSKGVTLTVPTKGYYADGELDAGESVTLSFFVCLKELKPFELFIDVLGKKDD